MDPNQTNDLYLFLHLKNKLDSNKNNSKNSEYEVQK